MDDATPGVTDQLHTAPQAGTGTIRLVAFGDSGLGSTAQQQVASRLGSDTFDLAIHTGDIAYSRGTYAEFEARFFTYYSGWQRATPVFPTIGNHENMTGSATPWRQLFVLPRDGASPAFPNNAERSYSFRLRSRAFRGARYRVGLPVGSSTGRTAGLAGSRPHQRAIAALAHSRVFTARRTARAASTGPIWPFGRPSVRSSSATASSSR